MGWSKESIASLAVFTAGVMWGVWWLPLRMLAGEGLAGLWPVVLIYAVSAAILLPTAVLRLRRILAAGPGLWLVAGCVGTALTGWSYAMLAGEVVPVSMLYFLAPLWATLLSVFWLGERPSWLRAISIPLGFAGAAVILHSDAAIPIPRNLPEWIGLGAGVVFAIGVTIQRRQPEVPVHDVTFVTYAWATLLGGLAMLFVASPVPAAFLTLPIVATALVAAGIMAVPSYFLLFWGSRYIDSGRVNLLLIFEGVVSTATASIFTDEPFGWHEAIGSCLVIGAVLIEALAQLFGTGRARARA